VPWRLGAPYRWFLAGNSCWFGAWGMQQVLLSAMVVIELRADPAWVGTVQMAQTLPALLFLLLAGSIADRFERRRTLVAVHLGAAGVSGLMALLVASQRLDLGWLVIYAMLWGSLLALQLPSRESILFDVGSAHLSRAVTGSTLAQFVFQAAGNRLAGTAALLGTAPLLGIQAGLLLFGMWPTSRLPQSRAPATRAARSTLHEIREGLAEVSSSERLLPLTVLICANGLLFLGPFFVLCPLIVRDVYARGIDSLAIMIMMFPLGTIAGSILLLLLRAGVTRRGRALLLGLLGGGLALVGIGSGPPFPLMLGLVFTWGLCGSLFVNMGRALFLEAAPASHRARVLSVYALGLLGMSPLSSLGSGLLAGWLGPQTGCLMAGCAMVLVIAGTWTLSAVPRFD